MHTVEFVLKRFDALGASGRLCMLLLAVLYAGSALAVDLDPLDSDDARVRAFAVRDLGESGEAVAIAPLTDMLGDGNVFVRAAAMQALYGLGQSDALRATVIDALLETLEAENGRARGGAAETLGMLQAENVGDALTSLLEDDDATAQHAAACALARVGETAAVDGLIALVSDESAAPFARMGAAWALGELEAASAVVPLLAAIHGAGRGQWNYTSMPVYAVEALGKINDPDCVPGLVEALRIGDRHLRTQIALTLKDITGEGYGEDREKWEAYLREAP